MSDEYDIFVADCLEKIRNNALEEAAALVEAITTEMTASEVAAAIRAMKVE